MHLLIHRRSRLGENAMNRTVDLLLAILAVILSLVMRLVALTERSTSPCPALYRSDRLGRNNRIFKMPKFRRMCT